MDKATFMRQLKEGLRFHFLKKDIQDILEDYESFFLSGLAEGKTEKEICDGLGNPSLIAAELLRDTNKWSFLREKSFLHLAASLLLFFGGVIFFWMIRLIEWSQGLIPLCTVGMILLTLGLWFTSGGTFSKNASRNQLHKIILFWHILLFLFVAAIYGMFMWYIPNVIWAAPWGYQSGPVISVILTLLFFAAVVVAVYAFYRLYCKTPDYFTLVPHVLGILAFCACQRNLLGRVMTTAGYYKAVNFSLIAYGTGVVLTTLVTIMIRSGRLNGSKAMR
jgi:uncharacterized membrane protein